MQFSISETQIIVAVLQQLLLQTTDANTQENLRLLIDKLQQNEYIRGRMLKILYLFLLNAPFTFNDSRDVSLKQILPKIKFKATPR